MSGTSASPLALLEGFFAGWRFPVVALTVIAGYELMFVVLLCLPSGGGELGSFADQFRIWCFGYDPATGRLQWASVLTMLSSPLILAAVLVLLWAGPLRAVLVQRPRATLPWAGGALAAVAAAGALLLTLERAPAHGELPFPAAALRTQYAAPDFDLIDHQGQRITAAELRGKVVLLTAVFARCGYTCPMIMGQARRAVAALDEAQRRDLAVVAVTLDPAFDTPEVLARMAQGQQVAAPRFRLCTGEPAYVERLLDAMGVARRRDPDTGLIDHANLFLLVDRAGRLAYRLTLGERQEQWLVKALSELIGEPAE